MLAVVSTQGGLRNGTDRLISAGSRRVQAENGVRSGKMIHRDESKPKQTGLTHSGHPRVKGPPCLRLSMLVKYLVI